MLESTQLRCFVAVAEELHFGRAAARLNMTQPPLSRQIQLLERSLGCSLLERTSRSVKLTQAGAVLLSDAQMILRLLENAAISAKDAATGRKGVIRCGFTAASAYHFLPGLLDRLNAALPDASLTLKEMVSKRQIEALDSGEIDIAFLRPPIDQDRFNAVLVSSEALQLVHHADHPLAQQSRVGWADLNKLDMIMYDNQDSQYFYDLLISHFSRHNIAPRYRQIVGQIHTIVSLVRARMGVAIVPASAGLMDVADLHYRNIESDMPVVAELYIAWLKGSGKPLIPEVVRLACETTRGRSP